MSIIEDARNHKDARINAPASLSTSDEALHVHDKTVSAKLPASAADWTGTGLAKEAGGNLAIVAAFSSAINDLITATFKHSNATAPVEIAISDGNSTQSAALTTGTYIITSSIDVAFTPGANPTATTAKNKLWSKSYRWLQITTANDKIAAIRLNAGETGTVSIEKQA